MFEYYYTKPFKFRFSMYIQIGYRVMKIKCFSRYLELQKSVTKNLQGKAVICHINYWDQVNSWKKVWKFRNDPLCRNKSSPFPLLNVAEYLQSSNTEACAKNLSQILTNNIDNRERGIGLRIYVRYYLKK